MVRLLEIFIPGSTPNSRSQRDLHRVWWHVLIIPAIRALKGLEVKFKATLGDGVGPCLKIKQKSSMP